MHFCLQLTQLANVLYGSSVLADYHAFIVRKYLVVTPGIVLILLVVCNCTEVQITFEGVRRWNAYIVADSKHTINRK